MDFAAFLLIRFLIEFDHNGTMNRDRTKMTIPEYPRESNITLVLPSSSKRSSFSICLRTFCCRCSSGKISFACLARPPKKNSRCILTDGSIRIIPAAIPPRPITSLLMLEVNKTDIRTKRENTIKLMTKTHFILPRTFPPFL